jgi:hypothetical protein
MEGTIFISVASYRDKICPTTLQSIYRNAAYPENVYVGICQQNDPEDDVDCITEGMKEIPQYKSQVRVVRLKHQEAKGPTYARFLCSTLYNGEEYYLQIDSHCKFIQDWDVLLIAMITDLKASGIPKPVLSHYTPNYEDHKDRPDPNSPVTTICKAWFTEDNLISLEGAGWNTPESLPKPNAYIAAGMFFCEGYFLKDIPFDPELDFLFIGEELLLSARFYTNGWDIFTPNRNTIYHLYTRGGDPKFWDNQHTDSKQASEKVRYLLGLHKDTKKLTPRQLHLLEVYGLGKDRSLEDYFKFAGIDLKNKTVFKNMCSMSPQEIHTPPSTPTTTTIVTNPIPQKMCRRSIILWSFLAIFIVILLLCLCLCLYSI